MEMGEVQCWNIVGNRGGKAGLIWWYFIVCVMNFSSIKEEMSNSKYVNVLGQKVKREYGNMLGIVDKKVKEDIWI